MKGPHDNRTPNFEARRNTWDRVYGTPDLDTVQLGIEIREFRGDDAAAVELIRRVMEVENKEKRRELGYLLHANPRMVGWVSLIGSLPPSGRATK